MRFAGEIAGLTTALLWAFGGLLFATAGRRIGSTAVNEIRLVVATIVLVLIHVGVRGEAWPSGVAPGQVGFLALSGIAGLALGDLFYFHCIVILGPRIGSLLMAMAPAMTFGLGVWFLDEKLTLLATLGIVVTSVGIVAVLADRKGRREWDTEHSASTRRLAVGYGLLAALGQASGNVLAKLGAVGHASGVQLTPLSAIVIRMAGATGAVLLLALFGRHLTRTVRSVRDWSALRLVLLAVLIGPTTGVWLYQYSLHHTDAAITAVLVSMTPIFLIPIAHVAYKARPSRLAILGTVIAVIGTAMLFVRDSQ